MARKELEAVLDYILNHADGAELDVLAKALERRRRDAGRFAGLGGVNPGGMAARMAKSVNDGIEATKESMRETVRRYVENIIRANAPDATEEEVAVLLDHYAGPLPGSPGSPAASGGQAYRGPGLVDEESSFRSGPGGQAPGGAAGADPGGASLPAGLPPDAIAMMLRDFTAYSLGLMAPSKQKELWDWMPRWQELYWDAFPREVQGLVRARLDGRLGEEEFWKAALSVLGL